MSHDDKFDRFVGAQRPAAPKAPAQMREAIWAKISHESPAWFRGPMMRVGAPVASLCAVLLLVIFVQFRPVQDELPIATNIEASLSLTFLNDDNSPDENDPWAVLADAM